MQWIKLHLADYLTATLHLRPLQHGIYIKLLIHYYEHERPLPADLSECAVIAGVRSDQVAPILDEFFPIGPDGLRHNPRADEELIEYQARREINRGLASRRWESRVRLGSKLDNTTRPQPKPEKPQRINATPMPKAMPKAPETHANGNAKGNAEGIAEVRSVFISNQDNSSIAGASVDKPRPAIVTSLHVQHLAICTQLIKLGVRKMQLPSPDQVAHYLAEGKTVSDILAALPPPPRPPAQPAPDREPGEDQDQAEQAPF